MADNSFTVEYPDGKTPKIAFSEVFNAAVPMIDRHLAEGRGAKLAYRTAAEDVSYAALAERVNRTGNFLHSLSIAKGDRVLMVVKDCVEFIYLFWGAIKAGYVPIPLNTMLRAKDYQFMIEDSGCAVLVYSPEFSAEIEPALAAAARKPRHVMRCDGDGDSDPGSFKARFAKHSDKLDPARALRDDDCFWLYSSGSTGMPKGTVHQQIDMAYNAVSYAIGVIGLREDDICLSAAKLFFAYGLGNSNYFPLLVGATTVLSDEKPSPEWTWRLIERFRPTVFYGVPTLYASQLKDMETRKPDLGSLRMCISAGEALPPHLLNSWLAKTGLPILDGFGSTEAVHIVLSNRPDDYRAGTSGKPVPNYQAKIVDESGKPLPQGEVGMLMIKGDSRAKYYWNNPERTKTTMVGEWLNTGDTYYQDPDGYYVYCGRNDDMMKVGGIWCSPIEIEQRLIEHPKVLEAAIVGRSDDDGLIKPEAYIILKNRADASDALAKELLDHCRNGLARYKFPRWFHFLEELPKTATGKIQRYKLRANAGAS